MLYEEGGSWMIMADYMYLASAQQMRAKPCQKKNNEYGSKRQGLGMLKEPAATRAA